MTKVLIAGTFDIIHPGHINLIKQAKALGDFLVVIIARDVNVEKMKGYKPYFKEEERLKNLSQLPARQLAAGMAGGSLLSQNDKVLLGDLYDPYKIIKEEKPDIIALGYDQQTYVNGLHDLVVNSDLSFKIERLKPFKENVCKGRSIRKALEDQTAGFSLVNKPENWTSHDLVAKLRSITGVRQIGHTGTLDPFATGLLICAFGQATKITGVFDVLPKTYEATITLGLTSDTYDRTGIIQKSSRITVRDKIQNILKSFIGKQEQLPPMFSAKKIAGKKLYQLARAGKVVERRPTEIEIYHIELLSWDTQNAKCEMRIKCSTGTYIRSLAHDIGQKLGTGAILEELKRTAIGDFNINKAVQLEKLSKDNYLEYLIKPAEAINRVNELYARYVWQ